jgi:hypothetical protein
MMQEGMQQGRARALSGAAPISLFDSCPPALSLSLSLSTDVVSSTALLLMQIYQTQALEALESKTEIS